MRFQVELDTTYWEDFQNTYTADDFTHFIDEIVMPNPSLANIALFTFVPEIERNIHNYPVKEKLQELNFITESDEQCLYELMNTEKGTIGDHLQFLNENFKVVKATIMNRSRCLNTSLEEVLAHNSYHRILRLKYRTGITKLIRSVGCGYPVFWVTWESIQDRGKIKRICRVNFIESSPNLKNEWNEWENHSIRSYKMFSGNSDKDSMLFGPDPKETHSVIYYFRGKRLPFPFLKDHDFLYPISQRYRPLLEREVWRAENLKLFTPSSIDTIEDIDRQAWRRNLDVVLRDTILSYEPTRGAFANHAKIKVRGYNTGVFRRKDHTTTAGDKQCTEDMEPDAAWRGCRYKRPKDKNNPYCRRRENGLCKWPEAKRRTYSYSQIEEESNLPEQQTEQAERNFLWDKLKRAAKDDIDKKIVECLQSVDYLFKSGSSINYSKIARQIGISYKTVKRRIEKMKSRI